MRLVAAAIIVTLFAIPARAEAQEAQKWDGVNWYKIVQVDYDSGKSQDARRMIEEHFMPASEAAGTPTPVMDLWHESGEWDLTVIWLMEGGPSDLEWRRSPENIKWWKAFAAQEGGEEAAEKMMAEYSDLVERTDVTIARSM